MRASVVRARRCAHVRCICVYLCTVIKAIALCAPPLACSMARGYILWTSNLHAIGTNVTCKCNISISRQRAYSRRRPAACAACNELCMNARHTTRRQHYSAWFYCISHATNDVYRSLRAMYVCQPLAWVFQPRLHTPHTNTQTQHSTFTVLRTGQIHGHAMYSALLPKRHSFMST